MPEFRGRARYLGQAAMVLACLLVILPFVWILINSLKQMIDIHTGTLVFRPTLMNYERLLISKQSNFAFNVTNSAVVAVISTTSTVTGECGLPSVGIFKK